MRIIWKEGKLELYWVFERLQHAHTLAPSNLTLAAYRNLHGLELPRTEREPLPVYGLFLCLSAPVPVQCRQSGGVSSKKQRILQDACYILDNLTSGIAGSRECARHIVLQSAFREGNHCWRNTITHMEGWFRRAPDAEQYLLGRTL